MPVNIVGKIIGGGTPAERMLGTPSSEIGEVRTRKATPEELAELDRKLGKPRNTQKEMLRKATAEAAQKKQSFPESDRKRLEAACKHITEEKWRRMHAFVLIAGALHGWEA